MKFREISAYLFFPVAPPPSSSLFHLPSLFSLFLHLVSTFFPFPLPSFILLLFPPLFSFLPLSSSFLFSHLSVSFALSPHLTFSLSLSPSRSLSRFPPLSSFLLPPSLSSNFLFSPLSRSPHALPFVYSRRSLRRFIPEKHLLTFCLFAICRLLKGGGGGEGREGPWHLEALVALLFKR